MYPLVKQYNISRIKSLMQNNKFITDLKIKYEGRCWVTLKCLSIGTPNLINLPFVSNGKLMVFRCPNIQAHYNEAVLCLNFGTPENNEFSIWNKWKIYYF